VLLVHECPLPFEHLHLVLGLPHLSLDGLNVFLDRGLQLLCALLLLFLCSRGYSGWGLLGTAGLGPVLVRVLGCIHFIYLLLS